MWGYLDVDKLITNLFNAWESRDLIGPNVVLNSCSVAANIDIRVLV
jgi:hypothetical protein